MADETSVLMPIYEAGLGLAMAVIGWFVRDVIAQSQHTKDELAAHKLHVSETYAKDATIQQSLSRVHDRMDEGFKELRNDLKALAKK